MKTAVTAGVAVLLLVLVILSPAIYTLVTGDYPGSSRFFGIQEDDQIVTAIFEIRETFVGVAK